MHGATMKILPVSFCTSRVRIWRCCPLRDSELVGH